MSSRNCVVRFDKRKRVPANEAYVPSGLERHASSRRRCAALLENYTLHLSHRAVCMHGSLCSKKNGKMTNHTVI